MVHGLGRRAQNRIDRHEAFLAAAKHVAFVEGLGALTMQRLAAEVDCAVGTAYTYFPSKSALVAEVQREAIETLNASCERFLATLVDDPLTHLVGLGQFWVDTFEVFPEEARLLQMLMSETSPTVSDDDVSRVLPAALGLLDHARRAFEAAAAQGALGPGDAMERTVVLAAALNGVLLLDHVARVDPTLFDGRRLARSVARDLLVSWGADATALAGAARRVVALAGRGPVATRESS
ncbi:MAG: TetR/AcrR family transcriptional regulator [Acidimicrobiales bacterium]